MRVHSRCYDCKPPSEPFRLIRPRDGFTLVEVVVACMVFVLGVLALQGAATVVLRQSQDARDQALAAEVATAQFERLAHVSCGESSAGSETVRGVSSDWQTSPMATTAAGLSSQTIRFGRGNSPRSDIYLGAYRCR